MPTTRSTAAGLQAQFDSQLAAVANGGDVHVAVPYYEEALRRKPALLPAWLGYAGVLHAIGRGPAATRALETAAKTAPEDVAVLHALGEACLDLGKTDQARVALRNAIRLKPGSAPAHNNLANILLQASGDFPKAEYHFKRSLALDPQDPVVHYNYGCALAAKGMLEQGQAEFEAALRLDPNLAEAATSLGILLAMKGQLDPAIEPYRHAIQVKPDLTPAHFHLGLALLRHGYKQEAKQHFQSVIQPDPDYYQAQFELGNILLREGNHEAAAIHFQKASESPRPELRALALERLLAAKDKRQQ